MRQTAIQLTLSGSICEIDDFCVGLRAWPGRDGGDRKFIRLRAKSSEQQSMECIWGLWSILVKLGLQVHGDNDGDTS